MLAILIEKRFQVRIPNKSCGLLLKSYSGLMVFVRELFTGDAGEVGT